MRVAALNDVHGNLPALEAVLAELPDDVAIVFGGDITAGPMPGETLELVRSLGERALLLRGNADREPDPELTAEQQRLLRELPESQTLDLDGLGRTLFCHGSPRSDEEIVTRLTPAERLAPMLAGVNEAVVVHGHTHVRYDRRSGGKRILCPGSIGMPYEDEPGAYWALLGPDVELRRTAYDLEAASARIAASGLPDAEAWAREYVYAVNGPEEASRYLEDFASAD
jgi:putative phosphoesterase